MERSGTEKKNGHFTRAVSKRPSREKPMAGELRRWRAAISSEPKVSSWRPQLQFGYCLQSVRAVQHRRYFFETKP